MKSSITIGELKLMIDNFDDDQEIMVAYSANDYWKTPIACQLSSIIELKLVEPSEYHQTYKEVRDGDEDETNETQKQVVLIFLRNSY